MACVAAGRVGCVREACAAVQAWVFGAWADHELTIGACEVGCTCAFEVVDGELAACAAVLAV